MQNRAMLLPNVTAQDHGSEPSDPFKTGYDKEVPPQPKPESKKEKKEKKG
jgi:hypothetical protein